MAEDSGEGNTKHAASEKGNPSPIQVDYGQPGGGKLLRRVMHLATGASVIYYILPFTLLWVPRETFVILLYFFLPSSVEGWRIRRGLLWSGLREHERGRPASYLWFLFGTGSMLLFFPQMIAAPIIIATALGDVVIGETRHLRRRYNWGISTLVMTLVFFPFWSHAGWYAPFLCLLAGGFMFLVENLRVDLVVSIREDFFFSRSKRTTHPMAKKARLYLRVDDDFLLQIIPALVFMVLLHLASVFGLGWVLPQQEILSPEFTKWP